MDSNNPKISFIPKGSLVREESFLSRPRPRSALGLLAISLLVLSVGLYAGFYFYDNSFSQDIILRKDKIDSTRNSFRNAPQVEEAQLFSSRASVAQGLLTGHFIVSPALIFLSKNTVESIYYDKFSFSYYADGAKVEVAGEAPSYASLAYQGDVLRNKKELLNYSIGDVSLTQFGTVTFNLSLTFAPEYLSYVKNLNTMRISIDAALSPGPTTSASSVTPLSKSVTLATTSVPIPAPKSPVVPAPQAPAMVSIPATAPQMSFATSVNPVTVTTAPDAFGGASAPTPAVTTPVLKVQAPVESQSIWSAFWSKVKFW